jgi:hypothetical protein
VEDTNSSRSSMIHHRYLPCNKTCSANRLATFLYSLCVLNGQNVTGALCASVRNFIFVRYPKRLLLVVVFDHFLSHFKRACSTAPCFSEIHLNTSLLYVHLLQVVFFQNFFQSNFLYPFFLVFHHCVTITGVLQHPRVKIE